MDATFDPSNAVDLGKEEISSLSAIEVEKEKAAQRRHTSRLSSLKTI